jgi:hypothetical protein
VSIRFPLSLSAGYNLIALPVRPASALSAEGLALHMAANTLPSVQCVSIIRYDAMSGGFATHPVGTAIENFSIAVGEGYFVRCSGSGTWTLTGTPLNDPTAQIQLRSGYNLIGLPRSPASPYSAEAAGLEIISQPQGNVSQLIQYNAATGQFVTHPIGTALENFTLGVGQGYFIRCGTASIWTLNRP